MSAKNIPHAPHPLFWWQHRSEYWELPFYTELNVCLPGVMQDRGDELAAREQLWAIRELDEEPGADIEGLTVTVYVEAAK